MKVEVVVLPAGTNVTPGALGSAKGLGLIVSDIEAARDEELSA